MERRWIAAGAGLVLLLGGLLGCTSPVADRSPGESERSPRGLARVLEYGVLRVGMTGDQLPMNFRNGDGEWLGFEVAVMRALAANWGLRLTLVELPFSDLLAALERGEVDAVMSGMTITPRRNARVAFVGPYFASGKTILRRARGPELRTRAELDRPETRLVALEASTSVEYVQRFAPNAQLTQVPRLSAGVQKLARGEADALIADRETNLYARLQYPDAELELVEPALTLEPLGIAVAAEDLLLANLLDNYLAGLALSGGLERIRRFWFESNEWLDRVVRDRSAARPSPPERDAV